LFKEENQSQLYQKKVEHPLYWTNWQKKHYFVKCMKKILKLFVSKTINSFVLIAFFLDIIETIKLKAF